MSLRDLPWIERGALAFKEGVARDDGPFPDGVPEGREWCDGYDAAAMDSDDGDVPILQQVDVRIVLDGDRMFLADARGRMVGIQAGIGVEQAEGEKTFSATVTFVGLKMVARREE